MNDAATVFGKPEPVTINGRTYQIFPLDFSDHGDVQRWLDAQLRDPLEIVKQSIDSGAAKDFPLEIQKFMVKSAIEVAARTRILIGTSEADALMGTIEGKAHLLYLSIRKGDPKFTQEKAMALLREMDEFDRMQAEKAADVLRADEDPKAPTGDGSTTTYPGETESRSTGGRSSTT